MPTNYNPRRTVEAYRKLIARLDAAKTAKEKSKLRADASDLRTEWKRWQGEDSLHEMAFGEPVEEMTRS